MIVSKYPDTKRSSLFPGGEAQRGDFLKRLLLFGARVVNASGIDAYGFFAAGIVDVLVIRHIKSSCSLIGEPGRPAVTLHCHHMNGGKKGDADSHSNTKNGKYRRENRGLSMNFGTTPVFMNPYIIDLTIENGRA